MEMTIAVKERPILFSAPMVQAILAGDKTQTRRVVKPQPPEGIDELHGGQLRTRAPYQLEHPETGVVCGAGFQDDDDRFYRCPYGAPGDRLWVRETFCELRRQHYHDSLQPASTLVKVGDRWCRNAWEYRADVKDVRDTQRCMDELGYTWRPSIYMPRSASRITLEVTGVRVERGQDITDWGIRSEGVDCPEHDFPGGMCVGPRCWSLRKVFTTLWDELNAKRGFAWESNPWVWVVEFRRLAK